MSHSQEIEEIVLGLLVYDPSLFDKCQDFTEDYFYSNETKYLFGSLSKMRADDKLIDLFTVIDECTNLTPEYVNNLVENSVNLESRFEDYVKILDAHFKKRQLSKAMNESANQKDVGDSIAVLNKTIAELENSSDEQVTTFSIDQLLKDGVNRIENRFESGVSITGLETGFKDFDNITSGLQPADYVVIGARPSMGKTALAMNIVEHAVCNQDDQVVVFSIEMPAKSLMDRLFSAVGKIDANRIRNGQLQDDDWEKLAVAAHKMKDKKLVVNDQSTVSPNYIRSQLKSYEKNGKIGLVVIDYLQLMSIPNYKQGKVNEVTEISRSMKAIAKQFDCPVIVLSQLSRQVEQRPDKRPINSDLRDSGAIEQDADLILFLYRDEYYNPETDRKGIAELICSKNRNGEVGTHYLQFQGKYTRFSDMQSDLI